MTGAYTGPPPLLLFFFAAMFFGGGLIALIRPQSEIWWGASHRRRPSWQVGNSNRWLYDPENNRRPSRAGVVTIRVFGAGMLVASIALLINGFIHLHD